MLQRFGPGLMQDCGDKPEEGGDDVKSSCPYVQGYTRATLAHTNGCDTARWSESEKVRLGSDWRLKLASMKPELLVIVDQQRHGEYVPGPCTHRPSHHESGQHRSRWPNPSGREPSKVGLVIG